MDYNQLQQTRVLQEDLTCPVCLDLYRNPHLLSCGHNFCKMCLDSMKHHAQGYFRCPECRASHSCSVSIPKNLKLANISDNYRQQHQGIGVAFRDLKPREIQVPFPVQNGACAVPCDYCPSGTASSTSAASIGQGDCEQEGAAAASAAAAPTFAVKTCLKCEVSMCLEHVKPHLELPALRGHPLTEPVDDFWRRKCPVHGEIYQCYCMDDKIFVCNTCIMKGGHSGHMIMTMRSTMKDIKDKLDKQLYRLEKKYSISEKTHREQQWMKRLNKKYMEDCERVLNGLCEDMKAAVVSFTSTLKECTRTHCDINGSAIQKNISRISQDQVRLQDARRGIEALMQESDPFRFIEAYRTTGKQLSADEESVLLMIQILCRRLLRNNMFYPEYVDMEMEALEAMMEMKMRKLLDWDLQGYITNAISTMCHMSEDEDEGQGEDIDDDDDDDEDEDEDDGDDEDNEEEDEDNHNEELNFGSLEEFSEDEMEEEGATNLHNALYYRDAPEEDEDEEEINFLVIE